MAAKFNEQVEITTEAELKAKIVDLEDLVFSDFMSKAFHNSFRELDATIGADPILSSVGSTAIVAALVQRQDRRRYFATQFNLYFDH